MKKKITTLIVAISLVSSSFAQRQSSQAGVGTDAKLLSQSTQGDYTVSRYLVKESSGDNDEFSVRYKINLSRLLSTYDSNAEEIKGLKSFLAELQSDTMKTITSVNVVGYASPDGSVSANQKLAMARAQDFRQYLDKSCAMESYSGTTTADALKWSATQTAVMESSIPNKDAVLSLVKSGEPPMQIESRLKGMPESWNYMKSVILPPMRCVELCVKYNSWRVVERRTLTKSCAKPTTEMVQNNYYILIEEDTQGMIVNPTDVPLDYDNDKFKDKFKYNRRREKLKAMQREGHRRQYLYERERYRR